MHDMRLVEIAIILDSITIAVVAVVSITAAFASFVSALRNSFIAKCLMHHEEASAIRGRDLVTRISESKSEAKIP